MKKNTLLLLCIFVTALISAQDITFTFQNARITNDGTDDFYEADIYIESTADFKLGSGQIYFNYNTAAFGTNIDASGSFEYLQPSGSILAETYSFPAYQSFIANDNTTSRVSTSFQQGVSSGTITANNVTTKAKHLFSIKIKYIDSSQEAMVSFETGSVFLDQFFTACGPSTFGFPNCTTHPGVQLVNDTFNSTGAVIDVTPPVITLLGSTPVTVEKGNSYTDAGATANDNIDGDLTDSMVTVNNVNINVVGSYTVTYNVSDTEGNAATKVVRTVNVVDTTAPVITLTGANPLTLEQGDTFNELGATADDGSTVVIDNSAVNTNVVGSYTVTYNATDTSGNNAIQVSRTVNVVADTTVPVITLLGSTPVTIEKGTTYTDAGATANDNFDGDITASIVTVNNVNANVAGSYTVTYNVSDAAGNAATEVIRTVNVVADATPPVITLLGSTPVNVEIGTIYTDAGATANDTQDGDLTASIVTINSVNINIVGSYTVTYNVSDAAGNAATEVIRTVNVVNSCPIFDLPSDNFVIQASSETCENKNNGILTLTAAQSLDYQARVNGDVYNFSSDLQITDLSPGSYSVCIGIAEVSNCEQCFEVVVEQAPILNGKTSLENQKMNVDITTGTPPYTVMINNTVARVYDEKIFSVDVNPGDAIEVLSSVACEGKLEAKADVFTNLRLYPNPTQSNVEVVIPGSTQDAIQVEVRNTLGALIFIKEFMPTAGRITLPMEQLRAGVYFVSVGVKGQTFKVIKQ